MKINIGDKYILSEKLQKIFKTNEKTCKVIHITRGIITIQINSDVFSIKTETALENFSVLYTTKSDLSNDSPKRKKGKNSKKEVKQEEIKQEEVKQEEVKQEEVKQEEIKQEEIKQENFVLKDEVIQSSIQDNEELINPDEGFF